MTLPRWLYRHLPLTAFFTALAVAFCVFAQPVNPAVADPGNNLGALAKIIYDAVTHKQYGLVASLVMALLVWAVRKYGGKLSFLSWTQSKLGGVATMLLGTAAGALATALLAGAPLDAALVLKAVEVGAGAAGGWSILKSVMEHFTVKAQAAGVAAAVNPPDVLNK